MVWLPIVLLLGLFPALYAISANVPGDNSFGIGENVLELVQHSSGGIMYGINSVLTPMLVMCIVKAFHGGEESKASSYHVTRVIMFSRMFLMLVIPAGVTIMTNQGCYRGWLGLWNACQDGKNFDIRIPLTSPGLASQSAEIYLNADETNWAICLNFLVGYLL